MASVRVEQSFGELGEWQKLGHCGRWAWSVLAAAMKLSVVTGISAPLSRHPVLTAAGMVQCKFARQPGHVRAKAAATPPALASTSVDSFQAH